MTRRLIVCIVFVGLWMACGWLFHLSAPAYLMLGIPLVVFFQVFIARRLIRQLWVRNARSIRADPVWLTITVLLSAAPLWLLTTQAATWNATPFFGAGAAGAGMAAFAIRWQEPKRVLGALAGFGAALAFGVARFAEQAVAAGRSPWVTASVAVSLLFQFLFMFPGFFLLEEVAFRGCLDAYLAEGAATEAGGPNSWFSAICLSALRGLRHLPNYPTTNVRGIVAAILGRVIVHILVGVPLSFSWRKSGTLALPAAAHALIDAYRNVIGGF